MKIKDTNAFLEFKKQVKNAIEDLKTKGRRHRQIPNILTLVRLTAPCFIIPAAALGNVPLILGMTAAFSLTDLADGFIARKWKLTSKLGETLDAVTDKIFASTILLAASFSNPILLTNLGLECGIAGINTYKKLNDKEVKSTLIGKLKTWFLFSLVGIGFASPYFNMSNILTPLVISTTIMQVFTIASYLVPVNDTKQLLDNENNDNVSCIMFDDNNFEQEKLQKEKIIDNNTSISETKKEDNNSLKELQDMREFLVGTKNNEQQKNIETTYQKSKKDDLKN